MNETATQCSPTEGLMTLKDLAKYLSVSEQYARKLYSKKGLPYIKLGECVRFRKEAVDGYLMEHEMVAVAH